VTVAPELEQMRTWLEEERTTVASTDNREGEAAAELSENQHHVARDEDGRSHATGHPPLVSSLVLQRSPPEFEFVTLDLASSEALFEDVEGRVAP
jgi:hypothetical protein